MTARKSYPARISKTSSTESSGRYSIVNEVRRSTKPPRLIGAPKEEGINGVSSAEEIKNMLRGGWPRLNTTEIEYDTFVESIKDVKAIPGKKVLILHTKYGNFAFTKKPAEALMDKDPSLIDIGCSSSGKNRIVVPTSVFIYYISKIERNGAKEEKEQELDLDIDVEMGGDSKINEMTKFFVNLSTEEVRNIVAHAEFKKYKRIAGKIVDTKVKEDACDPPLPYLRAETEDGRAFLIYLLEEIRMEAKKTGSDEDSGVKNRYMLPEISDSCIKVDAGTHRYAVLVPEI